MKKSAMILTFSLVLAGVGANAATSSDWTRWQSAMSAGRQGETQKALALLSSLEKSKSKSISTDKIVLAEARLHFQNGQLDQAIDRYGRVPKSSDYWLEALEEKAWAHLRKNDFDNTLSTLQTLMAPTFAPQVGPEPYVLASLAYLKSCEYSATFKTINLFKERYRERSKAISNLAKEGQTPVAITAIQKLSVGPISYATLGKDIALLPRLFYRDREILNGIAQKRQGDASADQKILQRLQALAQMEKKEYTKILSKLQLIEAEAIQRVHVGEQQIRVGSSGFQKNSDTLLFPHSMDGEIWLDELDSYQVRAARCPAKKGSAKI